MKSFGGSEDVLKAKSNELSAPFKKHKITLYTIYAMWYLSMVEWCFDCYKSVGRDGVESGALWAL